MGRTKEQFEDIRHFIYEDDVLDKHYSKLAEEQEREYLGQFNSVKICGVEQITRKTKLTK